MAERKAFYAAHKQEAKKGLSYNNTASRLTERKRDPQFAWLQEAHAQILQQSLKDLDRAYQSFFAKRAKFPRFQKKRDKQTARYPQGVQMGDGWIAFPKIGKVWAVIHRACVARSKT